MMMMSIIIVGHECKRGSVWGDQQRRKKKGKGTEGKIGRQHNETHQTL
jgi:hypothetical protein